MDFIKEMLAFERWLCTNYLPPLSQLLWHKLFMLCNGAGWPEWIVVENASLMAQLHLKRTASFLEYRDKLIECGLVEYQKGRKGHPNRYRLHSVIGFQVESQNGNSFKLKAQTVPQTVPQTPKHGNCHRP